VSTKSKQSASKVVVGVVCEKSVYISALLLASLMKEIFKKLQPDEGVPYDELIDNFSKKYIALHEDIRKELGFMALQKATLQSSVTSAAPTPATKVVSSSVIEVQSHRNPDDNAARAGD
jgi:hypothetical protein